MNPAEWINFVAEHKEYLIGQIRCHLPEANFTNIMAGLPPPVVYLQHKHGMIELNCEAVKIGLDNKGKVSKVEVIKPSQ